MASWSDSRSCKFLPCSNEIFPPTKNVEMSRKNLFCRLSRKKKERKKKDFLDEFRTNDFVSQIADEVKRSQRKIERKIRPMVWCLEKGALFVICSSFYSKEKYDTTRRLIIWKVDYRLRRRRGTRHSTRLPSFTILMILEDVDKYVVRGKWHARLPVPPLSIFPVSPGVVSSLVHSSFENRDRAIQ